MQDKALDAMAKKYKEEMMRLYAHGGTSTASQTPQTLAVKPENTAVNDVSVQPREQTPPKDMERLMHPPMPNIPNVSPKCEKRIVENAQKSKFPSPDDIVAAEALQDMAQGEAENSAQNEDTPRFDNGHEQGNYDFTDAEREQYFKDGEGYLKLEVSGGGQPLDCALAAVFRVTDSGDVLTATFFTDQKGETEVITLPVLGLDEKYTVTVAKEGFFTVHSLEIPIFDSIKSIQPVELKKEQQ
ncbi:MAG: hypothetical protein K2G04_00735 [Oscillospiraceae bacterium]|nr:hypothetical protein [Oscillospiraceae bacterium]